MNQAYECLKRAHKWQEDPLVLFAYQDCVITQEKEKFAIVCANIMLSKFPNHCKTWYMMGRAALIGGSTSQARKAYQKSFNLFPKSIETILALSDIHLRENEAEKARKILLTLLPDHQSAWLHTRLGDCYIALGSDPQKYPIENKTNLQDIQVIWWQNAVEEYNFALW